MSHAADDKENDSEADDNVLMKQAIALSMQAVEQGDN